MILFRRLATLLLGLSLSSAADAAIVSSTQLSYFTVAGKTPEAIFRAILSRGPQVGGSQAIASIATRAAQDGGMAQSGGACHVTDYKISLTFMISRPRITNIGVLSAGDRAMWNEMNGFIIAHENQHKQNWLSCATALQGRITSLRAPSCDQFSTRASAMWSEMLATCDRKQHAFDAAQSRQLARLPFMRRARGGAGH
jgi:predicted secreted Zn-dependent protease